MAQDWFHQQEVDLYLSTMGLGTKKEEVMHVYREFTGAAHSGISVTAVLLQILMCHQVSLQVFLVHSFLFHFC